MVARQNMLAMLAAAALVAIATGENVQRNITCSGDIGVDHAYGDIGGSRGYIKNVKTQQECCSHCQANPACVAWVLETDLNYCFLKRVTSGADCAKVATGTPCKRTLANRVSMKNSPDGPPSPPSPPPAPPTHFLPNFYNLSAKYRNWSYYKGDHEGFVVPPLAGNFPGQTLTDTAIVFEKTPEDRLPGKYRMTYLFFNGTKPNFGYEVALALSDDLLHWTFNPAVGEDNGIVFRRSSDPHAYDYGGVTLGGMRWTDMDVRSPRTLKKDATTGLYYSLYGCYPSRAGYESGDGGQGIASSVDGVVWDRVSNSTPTVPGAHRSPAAPAWEQRTVYQPFLVESNGSFYDFYNAAGTNEFGHGAEESGVAVLSTALPGVDSHGSKWVESKLNPLIKSGGPGAPDTAMASDPKVFWDSELKLWVMFYFGLGDGTHGHADILVAFSRDLFRWDKDERPLYRAGGHPLGIDSQHAHKISIIFDSEGVGYLYYTAVGHKGRGIALLTSVDKN